MYNILVYSEDAGKFAKEYVLVKDKIKEKVKGVFVFGETMKIEDLKELWALGSEIQLDKNVFGNKKDMELFFLGRCFEQKDTGLACYSSPEKETVELGKSLQIEVIPFKNIAGLTQTKARKPKTVKEKTVKEEKEKPQVKEEPVSENVKAPKRRKPKVFKDVEEKIQFLLSSSTLTPELMEKAIHEKDKICDCISKASDAYLGLPTLLNLNFGRDNGDKLAKVFEEDFIELQQMMQKG